jgi:hypothetical protein
MNARWCTKYAQHVFETGHTYEAIENTMEILQIQKKGNLLITLERVHIYELSNKKLHIRLIN